MVRVPPFSRYTGWLSGLGLFISGMIVGAAVYMSFHHQQFTLLAIEKRKLESKVEDLNRQASDEVKKRRRVDVISKVDVLIAPSAEWDWTGKEGRQEPDPLAATEIENKVRTMLRQSLSGKPGNVLKQVPSTYYQLIESNAYKTSNGKTYKTTVRVMTLLQNELVVILTAYEQPTSMP